ncbi:N-acetylglucosamine-1-phosphotransferase subunit gamma-like [Centruroides vittatus]|uniref:N-acetylglucosamine-1-phosphotransferase subunit gamma-like n=1 Tax=Centruroides vittatus TaxID=120091 RepID=UPI003510A66B
MKLHFFVILVIQIILANKIPIKIVQEPATYGFYASNIIQGENVDQLIARTKPSNFSGPLQFKTLVGQCFNLTNDQYRYVLCPFYNFTQHEMALRWNAYQGILGIWKEWEIENNTFTAMIYSKGDLCGNTDRSAKVIFRCGTENALLNVTEPTKCQYQAIFMTPFVCHKDSTLVYPRLPPPLRLKWDNLETDLTLGYITLKGYQIGLRNLFELANFQQSQSIAEETTITSTTTAMPNKQTGFENVDQCKNAYEELRKEMDDLKQQIESLKLVMDLKSVKDKTSQP